MSWSAAVATGGEKRLIYVNIHSFFLVFGGGAEGTTNMFTSNMPWLVLWLRYLILGLPEFRICNFLAFRFNFLLHIRSWTGFSFYNYWSWNLGFGSGVRKILNSDTMNLEPHHWICSYWWTIIVILRQIWIYCSFYTVSSCQVMKLLSLSKTLGCIRIRQKPGAGSGSNESGSATPSLFNICMDRARLSSGVPRQCVVCGELAEWECPDCYGSIESSGLQVPYRRYFMLPFTKS